MPAVRAADIDINLDLVFASGAFVRTCHAGLHLLSKRAIDRPEGDPKLRGLWLVCAAGKLETALPASPYASPFSADCYGIAAWAAVGTL